MLIPDVVAYGGGSSSLGGSSPSSLSSSATIVLPKPVEESAEAVESVVAVKREKMPAGVDTTPATSLDGCGGGGGGVVVATSSSTSLRMEEKTDQETFKFVTIKEEEEEEEIEEEEAEEDVDTGDGIHGGGCGGNKYYNNDGSCNSSSSSVVDLPKPMEGLHESGPPPFLKKTFEMVESPETDPIVSWSNTRDSFIVWDSHEFSRHLLPKYFKHSNFSSFIRQLNTYGFRKIDPDRWEFANEWFQRGNKHLLKNIKRRSRYKQQHNGATSGSGIDSVKLGLEAELENLNNDKDRMKGEILKLRRQQEDSQNQLNTVEERIRAAECKHLQMFVFFTKAAKNPGIIHHLIQKRKKQEELDGSEFSKKRKLPPTEVPECLLDAVDTSQIINCRNQAQEQLATMQTELTETLPETVTSSPISKLFGASINDEYCSPIQDHKANLMCGTSAQDVPSVYNLMSEKLMDDNSVAKNSIDDEDLDWNDSKFYLELEDLIGRPRNWGAFAAELVEQAGCVG